MLGTWTWDGRIIGADESTELNLNCKTDSREQLYLQPLYLDVDVLLQSVEYQTYPMAQLTEMSIPMPETIAGSNTVVGQFYRTFAYS